MGKAKDIRLEPIPAKVANDFIKRVHYSGKVAQNSQLHIGVFYDGVLHGAMQFGPSLDKRKLIGLVSGTQWHEFMELNRLAFDDALPRNSESRSLSIAMRLIRKYAPQLRWIISYADATQCGDGTIYRAAGFILTGIKKNNRLIELPFADEMDDKPLLEAGCDQSDIRVLRLWLQSMTPEHGAQDVRHAHSAKFIPFSGQVAIEKVLRPTCHIMSIEGGVRPNRLLKEAKKIMRKVSRGATTHKLFTLMGGVPLAGFQLRYIYFLDPSYRSRLTVPEIPYSRIWEMGAGMYKGEKVEQQRAGVV